MSNQKALFELIKEMSGQANILTVPRIYISLMDSIEGGLLLSQIIYWSDKGKDGWFYKKYSEWEDEIYLSKYKVKKYVTAMCDAGFLETQTRKDPHGTPVVHYKLDPIKFQEWIIGTMFPPDSTEDTPHADKTPTSCGQPDHLPRSNPRLKKSTTLKNPSVKTKSEPTPKDNLRKLNNFTIDSEETLHSSITEITNIDYKKSTTLKNPSAKTKNTPVKHPKRVAANATTPRDILLSLGFRNKKIVDVLIAFMLATGLSPTQEDVGLWAKGAKRHLEEFSPNEKNVNISFLVKLYSEAAKRNKIQHKQTSHPSALTNAMFMARRFNVLPQR